MGIVLSQRIKEKLADVNHRIGLDDIKQCFANRKRGFVVDNREEHRTDPPTLWFVAENDYGVKIKVMFVMRGQDIYVKSAYRATDVVAGIYRRKST